MLISQVWPTDLFLGVYDGSWWDVWWCSYFGEGSILEWFRSSPTIHSSYLIPEVPTFLPGIHIWHGVSISHLSVSFAKSQLKSLPFLKKMLLLVLLNIMEPHHILSYDLCWREGSASQNSDPSPHRKAFVLREQCWGQGSRKFFRNGRSFNYYHYLLFFASNFVLAPL